MCLILSADSSSQTSRTGPFDDISSLQRISWVFSLRSDDEKICVTVLPMVRQSSCFFAFLHFPRRHPFGEVLMLLPQMLISQYEAGTFHTSFHEFLVPFGCAFCICHLPTDHCPWSFRPSYLSSSLPASSSSLPSFLSPVVAAVGFST